MNSFRNRIPLRVLMALAAVLASAFAWADPPAAVARIAYMTGEVSFSPAGEDEWAHAAINRPLISGDRLWVAPGGRAELRTSGVTMRMGASTSLNLLNVDNGVAQVELTEGTLSVRVRRFSADQLVEIDTPNLAFTLRRAGSYRITVDPNDDATTVIVRDGQGEVYGEGAAYVVNTREGYRFYGTGLRDFDVEHQLVIDDLDRWAAERDRRLDVSVSARYVSPDVIGFEDLDAYGTWRTVPTYGSVWFPRNVSSSWAPYSEGHWSWIEPWGWTWIDDAPWGFPVSHYGRWSHLTGGWCWVPGPVRERAVYAPALVAFIGGDNFRVNLSGGNVGAVAWFPLGPREVYRPAYPVSREYFVRLNSSNTVVNTTIVNNYYNNNVTNIAYANRQVPGAVVAVPQTAFAQAQPIARTAIRLNPQQVANAPVAPIAAVAPTQRSIVGTAPATRKPPAAVVDRPVIVRTPPPAPMPAFASRQQALSATPGRPLAPAQVQQIRPQAATPTQAPAPRIVVAPQGVPTAPMSTVRPTPPQGTARDEAQREGQRGRPGVAPPGQPPSGPASVATPPQGAPGASGRPDAGIPPGQRGRAELPVQPPQAAPGARQPPQPAAPGRIAPPAGVPGQAIAPPPAAAPPGEQRVPPGQRGRLEAPGQQGVAPPSPIAPQSAPPGAVPAPSDQRVPPGQRGRVEPQPAPPAAVPPRPVPPAATPPAPAAPERPRGAPDQPPGRPQVTPPAAVPPATPPSGAAPEPRVPPGQQRGRPEQAQPVPPSGAAPEPRVPPGQQRGRPEQAQPAPQPATPPAQAPSRPAPPQAQPITPPQAPPGQQPSRPTPPPQAQPAPPPQAPPAPPARPTPPPQAQPVTPPQAQPVPPPRPMPPQAQPALPPQAPPAPPRPTPPQAQPPVPAPATAGPPANAAARPGGPPGQGRPEAGAPPDRRSPEEIARDQEKERKGKGPQ